MDQKLVPNMDNILNMYFGEIEGTVFEKKDSIFKLFYEEMFTYGMIKEESFNYYR